MSRRASAGSTPAAPKPSTVAWWLAVVATWAPAAANAACAATMAPGSSRSRRADHSAELTSCPRDSSSVDRPPSSTTGPAVRASPSEGMAREDMPPSSRDTGLARGTGRPMVFVWNSGWGPRRRRGPGYGRGYGGYGPPPGYRGGYGGGGGSCLRDLLFLNAGGCLAESPRCGGDAFLLAPATPRHLHPPLAGEGKQRP